MGEGNSPDADGQFVKAPIFNFNDDKVKFNTNDVDNFNDNYGSASGLLPKLLSESNAQPYGWALHYCRVERIHPPICLPTSSITA
jgi:hypothetical protein